MPMKTQIYILMLIAMMSCTCSILKGAEMPSFYVSPSGNDEAPGTQARPFMTGKYHPQASQFVQSLSDSNMGKKFVHQYSDFNN